MELENVELVLLVEIVVFVYSLFVWVKMMYIDVDFKVIVCLVELMLLMSVLDNFYFNVVYYGVEFGNICFCSSLYGVWVYIDVINIGMFIL